MSYIYVALMMIMAVSFFFWLSLCKKLLKLIEAKRPHKYRAMGSPSLVNNSPENALSLLTFLFKKEWRLLRDTEIKALSKSMLVFFGFYLVVCILAFITCIALIVSPS